MNFAFIVTGSIFLHSYWVLDNVQEEIKTYWDVFSNSVLSLCQPEVYNNFLKKFFAWAAKKSFNYPWIIVTLLITVHCLASGRATVRKMHSTHINLLHTTLSLSLKSILLLYWQRYEAILIFRAQPITVTYQNSVQSIRRHWNS